MNILPAVWVLAALALLAPSAAHGGAAAFARDAWGQPLRSLKLSGGADAAAVLSFAGAGNEHLFLPILVEADAATCRAVLEAPPALGIESLIYRVVAAPPQSPGNFPPDALVPLGDRSLAWGEGPLLLWLSLRIPPQCPPGVHPLTLSLTDKSGSARLPGTLKVYHFTLPTDLPVTIFGVFRHQAQPWPRYGGRSPLAAPAVVKVYYQTLRRYLINALGGSCPLPLDRLRPGQRLEEFATCHDLVSFALNVAKFRYFQIPNPREWKSVGDPGGSFSRQARVFYQLYGEYLRRHGWQSRALHYLVDEPKPGEQDLAQQAYALAKSLAPWVRTLCAGGTPQPDLARVVDIWAYPASRYQKGERARSAGGGQEVWLYANRLQGINHPLAHPRLIGWLLYRYGFDGYLLWALNYWPEDPWAARPGVKDFLRRGTFLYPHPETGAPVPSTRLESLRRGFQDYLYLGLLAQAARQGRVSRDRYEQMLARVRSVTENLPASPFPVSMAELEAWRLEMGELLDRAAPEPRRHRAE